MNNSFLLDPHSWDLEINSLGNWSTTDDIRQDGYNTAQDVACAIKTFYGEMWFDQSQGIPYQSQIFGQNMQQGQGISSALGTIFERAAQTVPSVRDALSQLHIKNRALSGFIYITDQDGRSLNIEFRG